MPVLLFLFYLVVYDSEIKEIDFKHPELELIPNLFPFFKHSGKTNSRKYVILRCN